MNRSLALFLLLTGVSLAAQVDAPAPTVTLAVTTDRPDANYEVGETVTFKVSGRCDSKPVAGEVLCILSKDGWQPQPPRKVELSADGTATLTGKLDEPGFLSLRVVQGKAFALGGAAVSRTKIQASMPLPEDFDAFWAAQKQALGKVPMKFTLSPVTSRVPTVEIFDLQVDCLGAPVSGYFARPKATQPKSLPAILTVHGAGVSSSNLGCADWAAKQKGMLALDINAHGIPNGKPKEFYANLAATTLKDYRNEGRDDREKCYFKGMFLRLMRAIDFLTSQPEWDGKTLIVYGSSQGGFQAIAAAGLDQRVSFICAGVPAGCDHTGFVVNRICGWPKLVAMDPQRKPVVASQQAARYFDCVNFATRAKCRGAAFTVGYIDTTCPPTSVFAAYNALTIPKTMHADTLAGHTNTPQAVKFMVDAALKHARGE